MKCEYFDTSRIITDSEYEILSPDAESFRIIMCLKGSVEITDNMGNTTSIHQGETVLVPAITSKLTLKGKAELLTTTAM